MEKTTNQDTSLSFGKSIVFLLKNKYFLLILCVYFVNYITSGINSGVMVYFATYVLKNTAQMGLLSMASMLPLIIFMPFMAKLIQKAGSMQKSCLIGCAVMLIGGIVILFGYKISLGVLLAGLLIKSIGGLPGAATFGPFTAAANENIQLKTGYDLTGMFFSCASVGIKLGSGLGTAVTGVLLDLGKFDGMAVIQKASAVNMISAMYLVTPLIGAIITLIIYTMMDVEKKNKELRQ